MVSVGDVENLCEALGWGVSVEGLADTVVELGGDRGEVFGAVPGEVVVFWFDPRCQGLCGSQQYTGMSAAGPNS
ncbi:hypothetical protein GCM10020218_072240 [Dactylosporangium vinaceum]